MWWLVAIIALVLGALVDIFDKPRNVFDDSRRRIHAFESAVILTALIGLGYYLTMTG